MSAAILILCLATAASVATLCGGALALRFRDKLHLLLGFSAGAVIAVAFFDLLPQALNLASGNIPAVTVMSVAGLGFFG